MPRISKIEALFLRYSFPDHINYVYSGGVVGNMDVALIRVSTEDGEYGLGEVTHGQFCHDPVIGMVKHFEGILTDHEASEINRAWEMMYQSSVYWNRQGLGIGGMGGIDMALHDLMGKSLGLSVYRLLGGLARSRTRIYASNGLFSESEPLIADAIKARAAGFKIYKLRVVDPETVVSLVAQLHSALDGSMNLIVDAVQGSCAVPWSVNISKKLARDLERYSILWLEEPVRVENIDGYAEVKRASPVNIAGIESLATAEAFRPYLENNVLDVVQFDIATTGFTEGRRIANLASVYQKPVAIHSWGSLVSILAGVHLALVTPNCAITEYGFMDHPINEHLATDDYQVIDGYFRASQLGPGLGVEYSESTGRLFPYEASSVNTMISFEEQDLRL